jgi:hypothetical protein
MFILSREANRRSLPAGGMRLYAFRGRGYRHKEPRIRALCHPSPTHPGQTLSCCSLLYHKRQAMEMWPGAPLVACCARVLRPHGWVVAPLDSSGLRSL